MVVDGNSDDGGHDGDGDGGSGHDSDGGDDGVRVVIVVVEMVMVVMMAMVIVVMMVVVVVTGMVVLLLRVSQHRKWARPGCVEDTVFPRHYIHGVFASSPLSLLSGLSSYTHVCRHTILFF